VTLDSSFSLKTFCGRNQPTTQREQSQWHTCMRVLESVIVLHIKVFSSWDSHDTIVAYEEEQWAAVILDLRLESHPGYVIGISLGGVC